MHQDFPYAGGVVVRAIRDRAGRWTYELHAAAGPLTSADTHDDGMTWASAEAARDAAFSWLSDHLPG